MLGLGAHAGATGRRGCSGNEDKHVTRDVHVQVLTHSATHARGALHRALDEAEATHDGLLEQEQTV